SRQDHAELTTVPHQPPVALAEVLVEVGVATHRRVLAGREVTTLLGGLLLGLAQALAQLRTVRQQSLDDGAPLSLREPPQAGRKERIEGQLLDRHLVPGWVADDRVKTRPLPVENSREGDGPV